MKRIALLTPYPESANRKVREFIVARGYEMAVMGSFNEDSYRRAARITKADIKSAVLDLGSSSNVDGVFVSCTSFHLADIVEGIEAELENPVASSNHAMAWDMLRLSGIDDKIDGLERLLRTCSAIN
jgi:maleate isomerase